MKEWWPRIVILAALAVVLGVPFIFRPPSAERHTAADPSLRLVIVSPHNEQIRFEFTQGYNRWRQQQDKPAVQLDWRSGGGTSDLRRQVLDSFAARARQGQEDQGIGYDLFFGGGDYEHNQLARGVSVTRGGDDVSIAVIVPIELPAGELERIFPEPRIGSEMLYHPDLLWAGAALSSFGIVYNRDVLARLGVEEPGTWADLQNERLRHWVALADPSHSGSIAATYNAIVRRLGWTEGWALLRRSFANARYFTSSAGKVPVDVSAGEAAAGMAIDFYGRYQSGAIADDRVGYVDPPYMTAITADPISILRGAPNHDLANEFVQFVLSEQGQRLWQRRVGEPDGPTHYELRRLPVRRDIYTRDEMAHWTDDTNPFDIASPFPAGMPDYYGTVALISHCMAIDIHEDLRAAWDAILASGNHPNRQKMLQLFDAMPEPLTLRWPDAELRDNWQTILENPDHRRNAEVAAVLDNFIKSLYKRWGDEDQQLRDRMAWTSFFRGNYKQIVALSRQ